MALHHDQAALETRAYPVSKATIKILVADTHDITDKSQTTSLMGCGARDVKTGPRIFERYGLAPTSGSSSIYDGESLLITNTATNHRIIQTVLGVIEDTLRLREVEVDMGPSDPFTQKTNEN